VATPAGDKGPLAIDYDTGKETLPPVADLPAETAPEDQEPSP